MPCIRSHARGPFSEACRCSGPISCMTIGDRHCLGKLADDFHLPSAGVAPVLSSVFRRRCAESFLGSVLRCRRGTGGGVIRPYCFGLGFDGKPFFVSITPPRLRNAATSASRAAERSLLR